MTVAELIVELTRLPGDLAVYVHGYEGGFNDVEELTLGTFRRDVNNDWYDGQHDGEPGGEPGVKLEGRNHLSGVEDLS